MADITYSMTNWVGSPGLSTEPYMASVVRVTGEVHDDESGTEIGVFKGSVLKLGHIVNNNLPYFDIMDGESHDFYLLTPLVRMMLSGDYNDSIPDDLQELMCQDILLLDRLKLHVEFVGSGIGREVTRDAMQTLVEPGGLVVLKAFPLQHCGREGDSGAPLYEDQEGRFGWAVLPTTTSERDKAKLVGVYGSWGFRELPRSLVADEDTDETLMYLNTGHKNPLDEPRGLRISAGDYEAALESVRKRIGT